MNCKRSNGQRKPKIEIKAQGQLLTIKPKIDYKGKISDHQDGRGEVTGFSNKSRKRLLELIATLKANDTPGYRSNISFLTLTCRAIHHPQNFKQYLFTWLKRLKRKSPRIAAIWRWEYQKRGAPHAHLILYNAPYVSKEWIQSSWGEVINETRPFTRIERVNNYRQVVSYASKYIAKQGDGGGFNHVPYLTDDGEEATRSSGRIWGVYQKECLPYAEEYITDIPFDGSWYLVKRYCWNLWNGLDLELDTNGFSIFCENAEEHLKRLVTISNQYISAVNAS